MSTRIIDEIAAVKIPPEMCADRWNNQRFILCELGGDNNVIDRRTNKRARSWEAVALGENWQIIQQVCEYAGNFEGGMIKFSHGRGTPEAYIRRCRKALSEAVLLGSGELHFDFTIHFNEEEKANGAGYQYSELIKAGAVPKEQPRYGEIEEVFSFSSAQLETWLKGIHGRAWRNVKVYGPRQI